MRITRATTTIIPQTEEGRRFADECERVWREYNEFRSRKETTGVIILKTMFDVEIEVTEEE